jgi:hypothetical protein
MGIGTGGSINAPNRRFAVTMTSDTTLERSGISDHQGSCDQHSG